MIPLGVHISANVFFFFVCLFSVIGYSGIEQLWMGVWMDLQVLYFVLIQWKNFIFICFLFIKISRYLKRFKFFF